MQLKKWLTIDDAAKYLSSLLSTPVEPKDILQLALEHHLKLSINFTKVVTVMEVVISPFSEIAPEIPPDSFDQVNFDNLFNILSELIRQNTYSHNQNAMATVCGYYKISISIDDYKDTVDLIIDSINK